MDLAQLPPKVGTVLGSDDTDPLEPLHRDERFTPFTSLMNISGQPAASIPFALAGGLPVGVQAIGAMGDEATLYRLAAQVEAARPWRQRHPGLS